MQHVDEAGTDQVDTRGTVWGADGHEKGKDHEAAGDALGPGAEEPVVAGRDEQVPGNVQRR